ncbi:Arc family DNA-binding protein [Streptomyces sp. HUAS TT20]|uniref:Arc family DNA-binding protein n=1 Tax=Streptomyces sp. HUAS TT20 TaxID=3447509 RepID=UPI0021D9FCC6|nr:Arc family DNA-binding protein [Streptomyces sp. HUAS 15-9]UXY27673.1 Arc family DNA-binding protein [Streptomyces sp. HUAS 15-9]
MIRFSLRIPDDLHTWLVEQGRREHRSLNSEVVHLLEAARTAAPAEVDSADPCTQPRSEQP